MKKIFFVFSIFIASLFSINAFAQNSDKVNALWVHDTRTVNEPPAYYKQEIRADLKQLSTIGISTAYGFSTNLTISPWPDNSAGFNHQLSFNNEGVFYRNGDIANTSWNSWKRFLLSDLSGKVGINTSNPQSELDVNGTIRGKSLLITDGNIGIGTTNPQNKLDVNGTIRAKEIKVESNWADFVFKKDYKLPTLGEVKKHIKEKGTLPGVPSESDVKANGVNLGEVNAILLQKIEELTLYVIKQQEEIELLKEKVK